MDWQRMQQRAAIPGGMACLFLATVLVAGCSAHYYHDQADREVYGIIQSVEGQVFGHTNAFTINTPYSNRDPKTIVPPEIIEDRLATNRRVLSLNEALDLAAAQSRRYQNEKENLYLSALSLTGARYEFGPQFFANSRGQYDRSPDGQRSGSVSSQIGVDQLLKTGGSLGVSLANDLLHYYTGSPREEVINTLSVNLMQPLLRNFGRDNAAVERLTQAERNVVYAVRSYSFFQNQFAIDIVNQYFRLLAQKNIIRNNYTNYLSQVQSTKRLEARSKDRESINAVDLARQSQLDARNSYVNSVAAYFNDLDQFKILLGIPITERIFLDDLELERLRSIGLIPAQVDANLAFKRATERQFEILNSIDRFEDAKRKIHVAANQLKADLNVFANASLASDPPTDYTQFDFDKIRYTAGVQLNLPLDRLRERNNYRATLVSFEAELRNLALDLDNLKDTIDRSLRLLEQRRQNYLTDKNGLELANRRVLSNELLLKAGRAEVRDLVDAQNAQIRAQNDLITDLVSYQETRLQLLQEIGVIETESDDFWFKSHLENEPGIASAPAARPGELPREEVLSPDQIFKN
jgi:outer membrane protein TolC